MAIRFQTRDTLTDKIDLGRTSTEIRVALRLYSVDGQCRGFCNRNEVNHNYRDRNGSATATHPRQERYRDRNASATMTAP